VDHDDDVAGCIACHRIRAGRGPAGAPSERGLEELHTLASLGRHCGKMGGAPNLWSDMRTMSILHFYKTYSRKRRPISSSPSQRGGPSCRIRPRSRTIARLLN
jgi:mono/diheme cytochrome c family protein